MFNVYIYSHCKVFPHKIFMILYTLLYNTRVLGLLIDNIDKGGHWFFGGKYQPMKYMYHLLLSLHIQSFNVRV